MSTAAVPINSDHTGVPVEALEALRLRLTQLTHSLNKLQAEMKNATPPHWVSLQSQVNIILTQLASLSSTLSSYAPMLAKTVVYPLPEFPTTEQEGLLMTLLRKKPLPEVTEWIQNSKEISNDILLKDDEELSDWALTTTINAKENYVFKGFHTKSELEKGIDESNDENTTTELSKEPKYSVDQLLKFMAQGTLPNQ